MTFFFMDLQVFKDGLWVYFYKWVYFLIFLLTSFFWRIEEKKEAKKEKIHRRL